MTDNGKVKINNDSNEKRTKFFGLPFGLYVAIIVIVLVGMKLEVLTTDMVGSFAILLTLGMLFGELGDRIPIWNEYLGGGGLFVFVVVTILASKGFIPEKYLESITVFMDDLDFLALFICVLICGSILSVNRKQLAKSLLGFIPTILLGVACAFILGGIAGLIVGVPFKDVALMYVLPIMGGGNGGGAVPMSEIYAEVTGQDNSVYYSFAIAILTIANVIAIISASLLNKLGKVKPELTGNGQLMKEEDEGLKETKVDVKVTNREIVAGLLLAVSFYALARIFSKKLLPNVPIHAFAYMVLFATIANLTGIIPEEVKQGAKKLQSFFSGQFMWLIMAGVGIAYTDLDGLLSAITFSNVFIALLIVIGAIIGTGLGGKLFGFYPIESSITAGLCMANRGGSGDIAVLGAANRMELISYAQISSRVGGGIMLIIASILFSIFLG
ncbi:2-hydroxycarboxylate transporter family protein [Sporanaerobacter acetigenes]|uniref:2-hydroxycarboxylate transporter family protein n=1 Tax=Sporanaerobacter acetigenes TaxID=165813 RepID=UPI001053A195|nr:2-hydroxycarboxylate transporter family protein [Sporanaerobacter acetigenes]